MLSAPGLRYLRRFPAIIEAGSMTAASEFVHIAQPVFVLYRHGFVLYDYGSHVIINLNLYFYLLK